MKIIYDNRIKNKNRDTVISHASSDDVIRILDKLDGKKHTLVLVEQEDASQMMIGGGPENYIITLSKDDNNYTLRNGGKEDEHFIEICAGGQFGEFPAYLSNSKDTAICVINLFFEGKEDTLDWILM